MNKKLKKVDQMTLVTGIMSLISKEYPNVKINSKKMNAIINCANVLKDELNKEEIKASANIGLEEWLTTDDIGLSSKFMAYVLSGKTIEKCEYAHPLDVSDFCRCRKLLESVPEFKPNLKIMADINNIWKDLVSDWNNICELIDKDDLSEAYKLIKKNH